MAYSEYTGNHYIGSRDFVHNRCPTQAVYSVCVAHEAAYVPMGARPGWGAG